MIVNFLLLAAGSFLFTLSNPSFIVSHGLPFFAWFMHIPLFMLIHRNPYKTVWLWGGAYGVLSYCLYASWLASFHPLAMTAVSVMYFVLYAVLSLALKTGDSCCGSCGWITEWLVLCAFEYLKTTGFAGLSYGVSGYTQWREPALIQISSVTGVWGVTALVDFSSAWLYAVIRDRNVKTHVRSLSVWAGCLAAVIICGRMTLGRKYTGGREVKICAVQSNADPWKGGPDAYERDVKTLSRLTRKALDEDPDIQMVVWPETAVVPSIMLHYEQRKDRRRFDIIDSVLQLAESSRAVLVTGNDHAVYTGASYNDDYNAALVFVPGKNVIPPHPEMYAKMHLVPFTESYPFGDAFPALYKALLNGDTHMWTAGTERKVFHECGMSFSTPICFEDTFGSDCRLFRKRGAQAFINLSNDAWSESTACQYQHLAMAVFRCAENRIPAVRSTSSGQTCFIDMYGRIQHEATPFTETYMTGTITVLPQNDHGTLYTAAGDWAGVTLAVLALLSLASGIWHKKRK